MQALSFPQFLDPSLPTTEMIRSRHRAFRARPPAPLVQPLATGEGFLSIAKLHERLVLLAKLELPCTIVIAGPALHLRQAVIDTAELVGDTLSIAGKGFNLRLRGPGGGRALPMQHEVHGQFLPAGIEMSRRVGS